MSTVNFSGIQVDNITINEALARLAELVQSGGPHLIVTPNPEMIVASQQDQVLKQVLNSAALRLPDGISMVVVSKILGQPLKERVTGIDFLLKVMEQRRYKVYLLGSAPGVAARAAKVLQTTYPGLQIIGCDHGYFADEAQIITQIKEAKPDILFAGLGAGRQEKWLASHLHDLGVPVCVGVGGSFDVIAGVKKRAPVCMQKLYIEWLYRLITEPNRWQRQLALPRFLWLMFVNKML